MNADDIHEVGRLGATFPSVSFVPVHNGVRAQLQGVGRRKLSNVILTTTKLREVSCLGKLRALVLRPRIYIPTVKRKVVTIRYHRNSGTLVTLLHKVGSRTTTVTYHARHFFLRQTGNGYSLPVNNCTRQLSSNR